MRVLLIRHGKTKGNEEHRYIGRTDESLSEIGKKEILERKKNVYHSFITELVFTSSMKRCVETAKLIFPKASIYQEERLIECNYGIFEYKNYQELNGNKEYQAWIDSGRTLPFPGAESTEGFKRRCQAGFAKIVRQMGELEAKAPGDVSIRIAVVVHGGTIMAILERYGCPKKDYFDYQVKNGCGYILTPVEGTDLWNYQYLP